MKKGVSIIIFLCLFNLYLQAEKVAILPQIYKSDDFAVDDTQIYVSQEHNIFIYSLKDYKLVKKFGKQGEGPREFRGFIHVVPHQDHLIISSSGKVSFFTRQGEFLKEVKTPSLKNGVFIPLGDGFVGRGYTPVKQGIFFRTIDLYSGQLEKIREIFRSEDRALKNLSRRKYNLMESDRRTFQVENYKILILQPNGSLFIFNKDAQLITTIKEQHNKLEFTDKHKRALIDSILLANPGKRGSYKEWAKMLAFPTHFPPIQLFQTSDQKVFVLTHKRHKQQGECFIYDFQGKLLKHAMVPIVDRSPKEPYPLTFFRGKLYQVLENQETEDWELHISKIL